PAVPGTPRGRPAARSGEAAVASARVGQGGVDDDVVLVGPGPTVEGAAAGDEAQPGVGQVAVHAGGGERVLVDPLDLVDAEHGDTAVRALHLHGVALGEGVQTGEHRGAGLAVDVADDDGGAELAGGGAEAVPAGQLGAAERRDLEPAVLVEAERPHRCVHL